MHKLLLTLCFLISLSTQAYHSDEHNKKIIKDALYPGWDFEAKTGEKTFNSVKVKVLSDKQVQVFNEQGKRIFAIKCPNTAMCMVYTTNSNEPIYEYNAGELKLGGNKSGSIYRLSLDTIYEYEHSISSDEGYISFIIITSGGSSGYTRSRYDIDTENAWFSYEETRFDWLRYGHPGEYPYGLVN